MRKVPSSFLEAALAYADDGWPVLPLRRRGKEPLTQHGVHDATCDQETIKAWWLRWPEANLGLAIPHGFLVVDIDSPQALEILRAEDLHLPSTACAATGRGKHLWYSTGDNALTNRVGVISAIDIRAPGGYVVAPPSIHPSGVLYRWEVDLRLSNIAECPQQLLGRLQDTGGHRGKSEADWLQRIATPVSQGQRNQSLAQVAGLLFRYLPARVAAELALCWARVKPSPPLPDREVRRTIESIAGREVRRRGGTT